MRKIASKFLAVAALGSLTFAGTGCYAGAGLGVSPGLLYADYTYSNSGSTGQSGSKSGSAEVVSILGLVSTGDASIRTAAQNGGISEVMTVDHKVSNLLGVYSTFTTTVTGE